MQTFETHISTRDNLAVFNHINIVIVGLKTAFTEVLYKYTCQGRWLKISVRYRAH